METKKEIEIGIKNQKRKNLQEILNLIKTEKSKRMDIGERWWNGDEITLRDKEEFYHRGLFIRNLEIKKIEYLRNNTCEEYVNWYSQACSAENKIFRDTRNK